MKCPCKGCERRTLTCHGFCEEYQAWAVENNAKNEWLREQNKLTVSDSSMKKHWKNMTLRRRRGARIDKQQ